MASNTRQIVRYAFYKLDPEWRRLRSETKDAHRKELVAVIDEFSDRMMLRPYSVMATRADCDFFLWEVADELGSVQALATRIFSTQMGIYLHTPYSYLAMTRRSVYIDKHAHEGQEGSLREVRPQGKKHLFVYPFVKTREWYLLPQQERQQMMDVHIAVGHKYPGVRINTSYSFGLDDQEFVVSFEGDDLSEFLDLVMELRGTEGSKYTVRDTPVFTGISMDMAEVLTSLGD